MSHAVKEAVVAAAMHVMRAEFEVRWEFKGAIGTTVCVRAFVDVRHVHRVASKALEALDVETFDTMASSIRGSLSLVDVVEDLRKDAAKNIGAFSVWRFGGWCDRSGGE